MRKPVKRQPKKPYCAPVLIVHGTVREVTQAVGPRKKRDGGNRRGRRRTSL